MSDIAGSPTLEMVAAAAGVSRATVSRVVNGSPKVSPEVVAAVNQAVATLNYVPNRAARSLASRQTHAIALLIPEASGRFFGDPYFATIVQGIAGRLEDTDYILNLLLSVDDPNGKTRRFLAGGNVDGALVVSHHSGDADLVEVSRTVPTVFGGRPTVPGLEHACYVDIDNVEGARTATRRLLERGCRRIGTITGPPDMPASIDRLSGWRSVLSDAGMPQDAVAHGDFTITGGSSAMRSLLADVPDLDGVFVASDLMARGALAIVSAAGRRVPDDVAVVGYDDNFVAVSEEPQLTTVRQPAAEMGAAMIDLLLELLEGRTPADRAVLLPTTLVARSTA